MSIWRLTDLAQAEITALQADGVILEPIDILRIHRLALAVETPETLRQLSRGTPVPMGNVYLYPLTLAASVFLENNESYAREEQQIYLLVYAMAHGSDEKAMAMVGRQAVQTAQKWARRQPVTAREMTRAIEEVIGENVPLEDPLKKQTMTAGGLSATLTALIGGPPEIWERRCSIDYCVEVLQTIMAHNAAENKPSMYDPRIIAERRLALYIEAIRRRQKR